MTLPEFLSNDLGARLWVKKSMTDDLANDFLSAAIFGLGTSLGANEGPGTLFAEQGEQLKVALAAVIEPGNDFVNGLVSTLSGDEHGELAGDLIIIGNGEGAVLAVNPFFGELERDHGILLQNSRATFTLFNYGTTIKLEQADISRTFTKYAGFWQSLGWGSGRYCANIY